MSEKVNMCRFEGRCAAAGKVRGRPVVVRCEADLDRVCEGDILVTAQTDIAYVGAMTRAAAIVTETGGRFCHAAVFARECGKPTLLQVAGATELLCNVGLAFVNADDGYVEVMVP